MLPLLIVLVAIVAWSIVRLAKANGKEPFSMQALYVALAFGLGLLLLSQKGWLMFALMPFAVLLAFYLYYFWKTRTLQDGRYNLILKIFIVSTVIGYASVLGIGDGFSVLAWSVIDTKEGSPVAQSSMYTSIVSGVVSLATFIWLYVQSLMRK
ncbi:MAG: hypothetical protein ABIQ64_02995 [Candidatus Saccharimonadales bacterium]